ncbi:hypothetical protein R3I94_015188 [Phoxinus phoxinus]
MSGFDAEDLELEEELQDVNRVLRVLESEAQKELKAQREHNPTPVQWKKRDRHGFVIPKRPSSSSRKNSGMPSAATSKQHQRTEQPRCVAPTDVVASVNLIKGSETEVLRQELLELLEDGVDEVDSTEDTAVTWEASPESAATDWEIRNKVSSQKWKEARPFLVENMLATQDPHPHCGCQCSKQAVVRCLDCLPFPFLCEDCDTAVHSRAVLHNRESLTGGFLQPLSELHQQMSRLLPIQRPDRVCGCSTGNIHVSPGRNVAVITINGRYNLVLPAVSCTSCFLTWSPTIKDIQRDGYWPGTMNFCTLYTTDVFQSFYDLKMAAPGVSLKAYIKMLDERTGRFGRAGKISADTFSKSFSEWVAVTYEVEKIFRDKSFDCPACTPEMLAVSVDGNRKLYRFKSNASTSEPGNFEGVFIQKDEEVAEFVDNIHRLTNHISGKGSCGSSSWRAAKESSRKNTSKLDEEGLEIAVCRHGVLLGALNMYRGEIFAYPLFLQRMLAENAPGNITFLCSDVACKYFPYLSKVAQQCPEMRKLLSMRPFLSVMHAKAHTGKCEIKWGGAFQEGAGSTIGEEVEQVNSFLSRAAITTKYMSKAGRTNMLTLLASGWNKKKVKNMGRTLSQRYTKTVRMLKEQVDILNASKDELGVDDDTLQLWVSEVQQWAEETDPGDGSLGALQARIEELAVIIKVRTQNLYKQTDSNKRCHKIRKVILDEKKRLAATIFEYNNLAEPSEQIVSTDASVLTDAWPWNNISETAADLHTKRTVFEKVMAVRRLKEEEIIICKEMQQHWTAMKAQSMMLATLSANSSFADQSEDAQRGLQCLVLQKQTVLKAEMVKVKGFYSRILSHQPLLEMDSSEEEMSEGDAADLDSSTSDED